MTAFWVTSALLAAGALLIVLLPTFAGRQPARFSRSATNLAIHRDQLRELQADLHAGTLDTRDYEQARRDVEARLLDDLEDRDAAVAPQGRGLWTALAAGLAIPLSALALYFAIGNPPAIVYQPGEGEAAHDGPQLEVLVARLADRMTRNPEDTEGWVMLGRSYKVLSRFNEAAGAYANAAARAPRDAGLLAEYAQALAVAQGRRLQGEPEKILARALAADPDHLDVLALAGSAAFEKKDYAGAIRYWERLLPRVPRDSDTARALQSSIAEARSLGVR